MKNVVSFLFWSKVLPKTLTQVQPISRPKISSTVVQRDKTVSPPVADGCAEVLGDTDVDGVSLGLRDVLGKNEADGLPLGCDDVLGAFEMLGVDVKTLSHFPVASLHWQSESTRHTSVKSAIRSTEVPHPPPKAVIYKVYSR